MSAPSSNAFADLLRRRALNRMIGMRVWAAPVVALVALTFASLSPTPLRLVLFGGTLTALVALTLIERKRDDPSDARLFANVAAMGVLQLMVVFAAGGVGGPLLPVVVLMALVASVLLSAREAAALVLGVQLPAVWLFAWIHAAGLLPELRVPVYAGVFEVAGTPGFGPYVVAAVASLVLLVAFLLGRYLRSVIGDLGAELADDREAARAQHAETVQVIHSLSGQIAHELKNPLASIKGLTSLVRRDLTGVPAERMEVLRREVDRMQSILDEFLTYSRPLVPLAIDSVDLRELTDDVVALHEGLAAERGIRIEVQGDDAIIQCDPRKVRQVIINLLQNAIDVSERGQAVSLRVRRAVDGATLRVRDHGKGIAGEMEGKLFTAGMTTKAQGTGLGLVVARGLARQHGGELTLKNAEGGGAEATLDLPNHAASS